VYAAKHAYVEMQECEIKIERKRINLLMFNAVLMQTKHIDLLSDKNDVHQFFSYLTKNVKMKKLTISLFRTTAAICSLGEIIFFRDN